MEAGKKRRIKRKVLKVAKLITEGLIRGAAAAAIGALIRYLIERWPNRRGGGNHPSNPIIPEKLPRVKRDHETCSADFCHRRSESAHGRTVLRSSRQIRRSDPHMVFRR